MTSSSVRAEDSRAGVTVKRRQTLDARRPMRLGPDHALIDDAVSPRAPIQPF
jgi:hypothetical protein